MYMYMWLAIKIHVKNQREIVVSYVWTVVWLHIQGRGWTVERKTLINGIEQKFLSIYCCAPEGYGMVTDFWLHLLF